jgi:murein L,D-transpeptidase YafK
MLMKKSILALSIFFSAVLSYSQVPTSQRSINAIERNTPILEQGLDQKGLVLGSAIFIRVFKEENELELWVEEDNQYSLFKTYKICYYSGDLGPKTFQGDYQSPEGFYFVNSGRMNPWSNFHLSMNLGYPNRYERSKGYTGDYLMIHGDCVSIGCYAMTNEGIEEIYTLASIALAKGQSFFRVHIFPFLMTRQNMELHNQNNWYTFWQNLKLGYDWFQERRIPPNVEVSDGKYIFN